MTRTPGNTEALSEYTFCKRCKVRIPKNSFFFHKRICSDCALNEIEQAFRHYGYSFEEFFTDEFEGVEQ